MQKTKDNVLTNCPHYLNGMKTCGLFADGFYLPPKEKLLKFCLTPTHKKCPIYARHYQLENGKTGSETKIPFCRRRFKRIPEQRKVLIRTCEPMGNNVVGFEDPALTVDYSQGGMRIISNKDIPTDTLLFFNFDHDFLIPKLQGFAQLCWKKHISKLKHGIEAGLVFKDKGILY